MSSKVNLTIRTLLLCLVFYLSVANALAQNIKHKCEVRIADIFDPSKNDISQKIKVLGTFTVDMKSDNFMTKFYKLPGTKLNIGAFVSYSGELKSPRYLTMALILGKRRFSKNFNDLAYTKKLKRSVFSTAVARFPLKSFERGEVLTYSPGKGKYSIMVSLECEK